MERKDYEQKVEDIKADILREIKSLIPEDTAHRFKETFNIHSIDGETVTTEVCTAVEVWSCGMVAFVVKKRGDSQEEVIQGEAVYDYASEYFIDILDHLKKEVREKKLQHLRDIVAHNGNNLSFDGTFWYKPQLDGGEFDTKLTGLSLNSERVLVCANVKQGEKISDGETTITDEHLDRIIAYVESQCKKKFKIRAYETFSRIFEVEAANYEEAVEKARKELESFPFEEGDSDGLCFD